MDSEGDPKFNLSACEQPRASLPLTVADSLATDRALMPLLGLGVEWALS